MGGGWAPRVGGVEMPICLFLPPGCAQNMFFGVFLAQVKGKTSPGVFSTQKIRGK